MTYLEFHLIFNLPLLAFLLWRSRRKMTPIHWRWFGVVALVVLCFTFPWDNWAVGRGIWEFDNARVLFRIGHLPVEEIAFFLLEALVVCLLVVQFLPDRELTVNRLHSQSQLLAANAGTSPEVGDEPAD